MEISLSAPSHWKDDMLANHSQRFKADKIPSSLDSTHLQKARGAKGQPIQGNVWPYSATIANGL
jgi:hypothetical protein